MKLWLNIYEEQLLATEEVLDIPKYTEWETIMKYCLELFHLMFYRSIRINHVRRHLTILILFKLDNIIYKPLNQEHVDFHLWQSIHWEQWLRGRVTGPTPQ